MKDPIAPHTKDARLTAKTAQQVALKAMLGCCYYPEHWSQSQWHDDAQRMIELGLSVVRIGEFAWSRLEPQPNKLDWQWLDQAIEVLGEAGLKVVLGTPTATPPRWMLERYPDMLAVDDGGALRKFGSRRHYCFSHDAYRDESVRIATLMAERYGQNPYLYAWQIDNEYGCHDTVLSYSVAAQQAFRVWLKSKYGSIERLNQAWGNVFWSMEYSSFSDIDLPNLTVTEANPSHVLDFRRFSSDQVVVYNKAQVEAIRPLSDAPLIHNYMGRITEFDHFAVGDDLDIASWDSYPLGFLVDRSGASEQWQHRYAQQGDPDFQALHHDLYRAVGDDRWWVMEQQPGPVNWAPNNPAPLPGMVRLWTWEAIAHQAEAVCYFRWRQAPFAQEQMHAGLLRPDSQPSATFNEVVQVAQEIRDLGEITHMPAEIALVFDYESCWAWETQPQGEDFDYFELVFEFYRALRQLGLSVDILPANTQRLSDYKMVLIPGLMTLHDDLLAQIQAHTGSVLLGPRSGSKTANFTIPDNLPPAIPGFDCKVSYVETFAHERALSQGGHIRTWFEALDLNSQSALAASNTQITVLETTANNEPVLVRFESLYYLAAWPDQSALQRLLKHACSELGVETIVLPQGLRKRTTASHEFLFNYNAESVMFEGQEIEGAGVRWYSRRD